MVGTYIYTTYCLEVSSHKHKHSLTSNKYKLLGYKILIIIIKTNIIRLSFLHGCLFASTEN